jgi:hypothetical protein
MMHDWERRMEEEWERPFVHESGHALMAVLQEVPCYGICYEKDCGKFCCSFPPKPPGERAKKDYLVSAAGAAAERLIYGNNDSDAAGADRRDFDTPDSPSPEETINGACGILSGKKRHLKRLISMLKAKVRQVDFDMGRLPEQGMEGSEKRYLILLNKEELEAAMHRR